MNKHYRAIACLATLQLVAQNSGDRHQLNAAITTRILADLAHKESRTESTPCKSEHPQETFAWKDTGRTCERSDTTYTIKDGPTTIKDGPTALRTFTLGTHKAIVSSRFIDYQTISVVFKDASGTLTAQSYPICYDAALDYLTVEQFDLLNQAQYAWKIHSSFPIDVTTYATYQSLPKILQHESLFSVSTTAAIVHWIAKLF